MKCGYSREILALYVEDDLPNPDAAEKVGRHVRACGECENYCRELETSQALLKSRFKTCRHDAVTPELLAGLRHWILQQIEKAKLSWAMRLQRYALVGVGVIAIVSSSLIGRNDTLARPAGYREWVLVGNTVREGEQRKIYMNPDAYRQYSISGKFPDGTIMILETPSGLSASVKDTRKFSTGWAYYTFTSDTAEPLPQRAGCLSCHQTNAAADHVFTQYYPVLRRPEGV